MLALFTGLQESVREQTRKASDLTLGCGWGDLAGTASFPPECDPGHGRKRLWLGAITKAPARLMTQRRSGYPEDLPGEVSWKARVPLMEPRAGHRSGGLYGFCLLPKFHNKGQDPKTFLSKVVLIVFFLNSLSIHHFNEASGKCWFTVVPTAPFPCSDSGEHYLGCLSLSPCPFFRDPWGISSAATYYGIDLPSNRVFQQPKGKQLGVSST